MNKQDFKVGDEVEVLDDYDACKRGDILTIDEIDESGDLWFRSKNPNTVHAFNTFWLQATGVKLVDRKIHPLHDIIIAWLNGEDVQQSRPVCENIIDYWEDIVNVAKAGTKVPFYTYHQYRLKPKASEQELEIQRLEKIINDAKESIEILKDIK